MLASPSRAGQYGSVMTYRLILITVAVAAFAWGFSALVEHDGRTIRVDNARLACSDWPGDGCARPGVR